MAMRAGSTFVLYVVLLRVSCPGLRFCVLLLGAVYADMRMRACGAGASVLAAPPPAPPSARSRHRSKLAWAPGSSGRK